MTEINLFFKQSTFHLILAARNMSQVQTSTTADHTTCLLMIRYYQCCDPWAGADNCRVGCTPKIFFADSYGSASLFFIL